MHERMCRCMTIGCSSQPMLCVPQLTYLHPLERGTVPSSGYKKPKVCHVWLHPSLYDLHEPGHKRDNLSYVINFTYGGEKLG